MTAVRGRLEALTSCLLQIQERGPVPEPTYVNVDPPSLTWRVTEADDDPVAVLAGLVAAVFGTFPPYPRFTGDGFDRDIVTATYTAEVIVNDVRVHLTVTCTPGIAYRAALFHGERMGGS